MKNLLYRLKLLPAFLAGVVIPVFVDKKKEGINFYFGCKDKVILKQMSVSLFQVVYNLK